MKAYIEFTDGLIGDFLGGIPAIQIIAMGYDETEVRIHPEAQKILPIIKRHPSLHFSPESRPRANAKRFLLDSSSAFQVAVNKNIYMSQAYIASLFKEVPAFVPKAQLEILPIHTPSYDFLISPFARSLPPEQKVDKKVWEEFIASNPTYSFAILGNSKYDPMDYLAPQPNLSREFDHDFQYLSNLMKNSKHGLVSVVTGTSHLAFHLGVKNFLINNQNFVWGTNPEAKQLRKHIPLISSKDLTELCIEH